MYSHRELSRLSAHKAALRGRIAGRRTLAAALATRALRPVAWLDRLRDLWRGVAPFAGLAAIPLGLLLKRSPAPRPRLLGTLLRWAPVVLGAVRGLTAARRE
ncbi:hypothetical protein Verru16b_01493 [Lacunisphaera limnophila]|uniref:YqjK-like protein n=1 Tax=Lacunisphaera limnophila TaxID=1838286 RepID=A0A1D8AU68_9BACT|nr:hypothetical protein [Lacunisphaera limnophila]AOS44431.1 hypothetical protein Verru16b_01493 [Lacunisphaera limnophila]